MIFDPEFVEVLNDYKKRHPLADDPCDYLIAFGEDQLIQILKDANGRRVIFTAIENTEDGASYAYSESN